MNCENCGQQEPEPLSYVDSESIKKALYQGVANGTILTPVDTAKNLIEAVRLVNRNGHY